MRAQIYEEGLKMAKATYGHLFAVDENRGIRANVIYKIIGKEYIGSYFGYEGGGCYSDGMFVIDSKGNVERGWDTGDFSKKYEKDLHELQQIRMQYEGYDEEDDIEGIPSEKGEDLYGLDNTVDHGNYWEYRSDDFEDKIITTISGHWGLSMKWLKG